MTQPRSTTPGHPLCSVGCPGIGRPSSTAGGAALRDSHFASANLRDTQLPSRRTQGHLRFGTPTLLGPLRDAPFLRLSARVELPASARPT